MIPRSGGCGARMGVGKRRRIASHLALSLGLCLAACGDDDTDEEHDSGLVPAVRVAPYAPDGGRDGGLWDAGAPPDPREATLRDAGRWWSDDSPAPVPRDGGSRVVDWDDGRDDDAGTAAGPKAPETCIAIASGQARTLDAVLDDSSATWLRIDGDRGCPASRLTATRVAYHAIRICAEPFERTLTLTMLGADMLSGVDGPLEDPMLVVYPVARAWLDRPLACVAASDDGIFASGTHNSARIVDLVVPAGRDAHVLATSHQPPAQRGLGRFQLELAAR